MKFGSKWLNWIKACVCYASFLVLINDSLTIDFQATRGLQQGDPFSQFQFIFAAEGLVGLLRNACANGYYHPFSLVDSLHIDLLQFADDTMIMGQPS